MEDERNSAGEFGTRAKSGIGKKRRWIENIKRDKQSAKFRNPQRRIKISKNQVESPIQFYYLIPIGSNLI